MNRATLAENQCEGLNVLVLAAMAEIEAEADDIGVDADGDGDDGETFEQGMNRNAADYDAAGDPAAMPP